MAEESLRGVLKALRTVRGQSVAAVAHRAGIDERTLRRWESGEALPRVHELRAALKALQASPETRQHVFSLLKVVRSVVELRQFAAGTGLEPAWMPVSGDLWRALRLRAQLDARALAARVGVHPSTVTRWEQSRAVPSAAVRSHLLAVLGARADEWAVLNSSDFTVHSPLREVLTSLSACEEYLALLIEDCARGEVNLADLRFLALEAQVWPWAVRNTTGALPVLARTWAYHADYLLWRGRLSDMEHYAKRSLEVLEDADPHAVLRAVSCQAHYAVHYGGRRDFEAGLKILNEKLDFAATHTDTIGITCDMAAYAAGDGQTERALDLVRQSREGANRRDDIWALRAADHVEAGIHVGMNQPQAALPLITDGVDDTPNHRACAALLKANVLLLLGDRHEAEACLRLLYALAEMYDLAHLRNEGDALARRL